MDRSPDILNKIKIIAGSKVVEIVFLLLAGAVSLWPAFYTKYPLLFFDSGTYLLNGFLNELPISRPIFYCWFVRHISMAYTLWFVVIAQAAIMTYMLYMTLKVSGIHRFRGLFVFLASAVLSFTTWYAFENSMIMADFFTASGLLGLYILVAGKKLHPAHIVAVSVILIFGNVSHLSNLPVIGGTLLSLVVLLLVFKKFRIERKVLRKLVFTGSMVGLSWLLLPSVNFFMSGSFTFSRVSNVVHFAKLLTTGMMQDFINEKCVEDPEFSMCKYTGALDDYTRLDYFLWQDSSFLYDDECSQRGWEACWLEKNDEYRKIISEFRGERKYLLRYLGNSLNIAIGQLTSIRIMTFPSLEENKAPHFPIKHYFKDDVENFLGSRQFEERMSFPLINAVQNVVVLISLVLIVAWYVVPWLRRRISPNLGYLVLITFLALLVNPVAIGLFAIGTGRFQGRIIWLVPFIAMILIFSLIVKSNKNKKTS